LLTNSTKCWCTFMCKWPMLENERRRRPKSKVTRRGSEATTSRRIRCVHEDLRSHQSTQTDSRLAHTHIYDMRAHLAAFRPRFGPNGHVVWPADHHGCPTIMVTRPCGGGPRAPPTLSDKWHLVVGAPWWFGFIPGVAPSYKYKGRGGSLL